MAVNKSNYDIKCDTQKCRSTHSDFVAFNGSSRQSKPNSDSLQSSSSSFSFNGATNKPKIFQKKRTENYEIDDDAITDIDIDDVAQSFKNSPHYLMAEKKTTNIHQKLTTNVNTKLKTKKQEQTGTLSKHSHFKVEKSSTHFWQKLIKILINTRCTEQLIWATSTALGLLVLGMQITPIFLRNWVHITEPKAINQTNEKGEFMEVPILFNIGYFRVCQQLPQNLSDYGVTNIKQLLLDYPRTCIWNPLFISDEISDFSSATSAILARFGESTILHIVGSFFTALAFLLSIIGHINRSNKTLCSAIAYFIGGLLVMAGVLQVICVVDDEMYPKMKPNASGEPSNYTFHYGYSFLAAALSFLPIQICIYLQTNAFFNRFPDPQEKALIVPGLIERVSTIRLRTHQLGKYAIFGKNLEGNDVQKLPANVRTSSIGGSISGVSVNFANKQRRESRAPSRDFGAFGVYQEVRSLPSPLSETFIRRSSSQLYF